LSIKAVYKGVRQKLVGTAATSAVAKCTSVDESKFRIDGIDCSTRSAQKRKSASSKLRPCPDCDSRSW